MSNIHFSSSTIAGFIIAAALCLIIPIGALIIYKRKNKDIPISSFFIGCGTFALFAMILESLLHKVMIPIVGDSILFYALYGAFAAGIFEETGRFIVFKTIMKKRTDPRNSIVYGLGHGGFEAVFLVSLSFFSIACTALMVNAMGADAFVEMTTNPDSATGELIYTQLDAYAQMTLGLTLLSVLERVIAIVFHTAASVIVFAGANVKGKTWLYPLAILIHAALDIPAALYQKGAANIVFVYIMMIIFTAITVFIAYKCFGLMQRNAEEKETINE